MPGVVQQEWLNQNSLRAYPFSENSQRRPYSGNDLMPSAYALPNGFILDVVMSVPADTDAANGVYLSRFTMSAGVATFVFSASLSSYPVASVSVDLSKHSNYGSYMFSGAGTYRDVRGNIVVGDPVVFREYPDGIFAFNPEETSLEARCIRPDIAGVRSIGTSDDTGSYTSTGLQGDVKLIAGSNISLRYDEDNNAIWIDADSNAGYNEICACGGGGGGGGGGEPGGGNCIQTINGISVANVVIEGGDCVSVETKKGRIKIENTCCKPCASCEELNFLNSKTNGLLSAVNSLSSYADMLNMRISQFETAYTNAKNATLKYV